MKKNILIVVLVMLLIASAVMNFISFGGGASKVVGFSDACDGLISEYNEYIYGESEKTTENAKAFLSKVQEKDVNNENPTCQMMAYYLSIYALDEDAGKKAVENLEKLTAKGLNPSLKLETIQGIDNLKNIIDGNTSDEGRG